MMLGGFVKQMNDTIQYNRSLLGKTKRKPFTKGEYKWHHQPNELVDSDNMSCLAHEQLVRQIRDDNRREIRQQLAILIALIVLTGVLAVYFGPFLI